MSTASDRGKHMRTQTASAAFGIVDPVTPHATDEYDPPIRRLVSTENGLIAVELIDGSTGVWPVIANIPTPNMQVVKVLVAGTNVGVGVIKGLL